ncbi:unnamed protein product [Nesidiocoris tenuis]|uniref:Uncharacterized protein n=1 Tax=Nesidiocoris tenuis TaxID=355587 RepID=A0A6H5GWM5_9HEMI|nr:unnamed protein product [Nesidiocoris tenuis]
MRVQRISSYPDEDLPTDLRADLPRGSGVRRRPGPAPALRRLLSLIALRRSGRLNQSAARNEVFKSDAMRCDGDVSKSSRGNAKGNSSRTDRMTHVTSSREFQNPAPPRSVLDAKRRFLLSQHRYRYRHRHRYRRKSRYRKGHRYRHQY